MSDQGDMFPIEIPETPKHVYAPPFERFYQTYPRRVGKGAAYRAWQKAIAGMTEDEIDQFTLTLINAIKAQKKYRDGYDGEYALPPWKHPATWLNQACWLDELESIAAPKQVRELGTCKEPGCEKEVIGFSHGMENYCAYHYSMAAQGRHVVNRDTLMAYLYSNPQLRKRKGEGEKEWQGRLRNYVVAKMSDIGRA